MKDIVSLAGYAGKVLCLVVFVGLAQTCGLRPFAAIGGFHGGVCVTPGDARCQSKMF
jgi:hypothetical protein